MTNAHYSTLEHCTLKIAHCTFFEMTKQKNMETITFHCKVITPMFLAGADGQTPELRAPSIKGAMRFWWRALNGHLPLQDRMERHNGEPRVMQAGLRSCEAAIFGGESRRSSFFIQIRHTLLATESQPLVPHKGMHQPAYRTGETFDVILSIPVSYGVWVKECGQKIIIFDREKLLSLFYVTCMLGGLGKRVRRGMGSMDIVSWRINDEPAHINEPVTLAHIYKHIAALTPYYSLENDRILFSWPGKRQAYGWVRYIHLGQPRNDLLRRISNTTNTLHQRQGYDVSLGHAFKGRFASPVYVSTVLGSLRPIITTLNTLPDRGIDRVSLSLQEEFRKNIL